MDMKKIMSIVGDVAQGAAKMSGNPNAPVAQAGKTLFGSMSPNTAQAISEEAITDGAEAVESAPKKTSFLQRLGKAAGGLLGKVAPIAASFIPGIGPIASKVLSTLNDDEWFEEFTSAGATFNELLAVSARSVSSSTKPTYSLIGALAIVTTEPFANSGSDWKDQLLPSVLAYVRDKTNNVLNGTENDYWDAFITGSKLYAIYYQGCKYIEIAKHLPLNIPNLPNYLTTIKPANYSQLVGVIEALGDYLKTTIKLPYAWTEYLRWRFGTAFKSSNTGKPGLILYNYPGFTNSITPTDLDNNIIQPLKNTLVSTGRSVADILLAYKDHAIRYDVEESHYDEKEFCLRCNMFSSLTTVNMQFNDVALYMDSRLSASEAIQAVTLSTGGLSNLAPLYVNDILVAWYQSTTLSVPFEDSTAAQGIVSIAAGWHDAHLRVGTNETYSIQTYMDSASTYAARIIGGRVTYANSESSENEAAYQAWIRKLAIYTADSLEFHGFLSAATFTDQVLGSEVFNLLTRTLAYDTAIVSRSQISAIQRTAMRNLTRGTYKNKKPIATRPDIKEAVSDVVDTVATEMKEKM